MILLGLDFLLAENAKPNFSAKMVLANTGAIFFPVTREHRDMKADGLSYEDDYRGNALAAMLAPGRIEIRFHKNYTDNQAAATLRAVLTHPDLAFMRTWSATYQGRPLPA